MLYNLENSALWPIVLDEFPQNKDWEFNMKVKYKLSWDASLTVFGAS